MVAKRKNMRAGYTMHRPQCPVKRDTSRDFRGRGGEAAGHVLGSRWSSLGLRLPSRTAYIRHPEGESGFRLESVNVLCVDPEQFPPIVKGAKQVMERGRLGGL